MAIAVSTQSLFGGRQGSIAMCDPKIREQVRQKQLQEAEAKRTKAKQAVYNYCRINRLHDLSPQEIRERLYYLFAPIYAVAWAWEMMEQCRLAASKIDTESEETKKMLREMSRCLNQAKERYDLMVRERVTEPVRKALTSMGVRGLNAIRPTDLYVWRRMLEPRYKKVCDADGRRLRANTVIGVYVLRCVEEMQREFGDDLEKHTQLSKILGEDYRDKVGLPYTLEALKAGLCGYIDGEPQARSAVDKRILKELREHFRAVDFYGELECFFTRS